MDLSISISVKFPVLLWLLARTTLREPWHRGMLHEAQMRLPRLQVLSALDSSHTGFLLLS